MTFTPTVYTPYDTNATHPKTGPRAATLVSSATPELDVDKAEFLSITALAVPITGFVLTGHPGDGKRIRIRVKDNGTARAIAAGSQIIAGNVAVPTTTVAGKTMTIDLEYDAVAAKYAVQACASRA